MRVKLKWDITWYLKIHHKLTVSATMNLSKVLVLFAAVVLELTPCKPCEYTIQKHTICQAYKCQEIHPIADNTFDQVHENFVPNNKWKDFDFCCVKLKRIHIRSRCTHIFYKKNTEQILAI